MSSNPYSIFFILCSPCPNLVLRSWKELGLTSGFLSVLSNIRGNFPCTFFPTPALLRWGMDGVVFAMLTIYALLIFSDSVLPMQWIELLIFTGCRASRAYLGAFWVWGFLNHVLYKFSSPIVHVILSSKICKKFLWNVCSIDFPLHPYNLIFVIIVS